MLKYNCGNLLAKVVDKNLSATFTGQFTDVAHVEFELTESKHEKEENSDSEELSPTTKNRGRNRKERKQFKSIVS